MGTELMRANRVAVKANGDNFVADFYRTHKAIASIHSENTDWVAPEDATNKTAARESFRQWIIANAEEYNINWDPADKRSDSNVRRARYETDESLVEDAMCMIIPQMKVLVEKCKYPIEWAGISHEDIIPMTHTGSGRSLDTMGIVGGKYEKTGNWAWAELGFVTIFKFKGEECYVTTPMQLVSGQLKKVNMGITEFTSKVKEEIINSGLATEDELDPPKAHKKSNKQEEVVISGDDVVETTVEEDADVETPQVDQTEEEMSAPKRRRRRKSMETDEQVDE